MDEDVVDVGIIVGGSIGENIYPIVTDAGQNYAASTDTCEDQIRDASVAWLLVEVCGAHRRAS